MAHRVNVLLEDAVWRALEKAPKGARSPKARCLEAVAAPGAKRPSKDTCCRACRAWGPSAPPVCWSTSKACGRC